MKTIILSLLLFFTLSIHAETIDFKMTITDYSSKVLSEITFTNVDTHEFQTMSVISEQPEIECDIILSPQHKEGYHYYQLTLTEYSQNDSIVSTQGYTLTNTINMWLSSDRYICEVELIKK